MRSSISRTAGLLLASLCLCFLTAANLAQAAYKDEIDAKVSEALTKFYKESAAGNTLAGKAVGMLVFPNIVKAGAVVGGEYGEGALIVGGETVAYYSTASASVGFQLGVQVKSEVIMFMNQDALERFQYGDGWQAGVDGSVAVVEFGKGGEINSNTLQQPIVGFIFSNKGLMYNLTFEGSKMSKINR